MKKVEENIGGDPSCFPTPASQSNRVFVVGCTQLHWALLGCGAAAYATIITGGLRRRVRFLHKESPVERSSLYILGDNDYCTILIPCRHEWRNVNKYTPHKLNTTQTKRTSNGMSIGKSWCKKVPIMQTYLNGSFFKFVLIRKCLVAPFVGLVSRRRPSALSSARPLIVVFRVIAQPLPSGCCSPSIVGVDTRTDVWFNFFVRT